VRRIATGLRPPGLDHRDLGGAIEYEARRMSAISGIAMPVNARVVESVRIFADSLLLDLKSEERCLLQADLDAITVDGAGG